MRALLVVPAVALALALTGCAGSAGRPAANSPPTPAPIAAVTTPTPLASASSSGAKPFANLDWRDGGAATVVRAAAPRSTAISGVNDLYADGDVVLAATRSGLSRSTDGGRRWRTVLPGGFITSVTHGPDGYVAFGNVGQRGRLLTATSPDGVRWRSVVSRPPRPAAYVYGYRAAFDGGVGIAVPQPTIESPGFDLIRTVDGGRRWTVVPHFREADGGVALATGGTMYVTGRASPLSCVGGVYRSVDRGATWTLLAGSCVSQPLMDVQFLDADHAVAVGGLATKFNGGQVIETTADGGQTWTVTRKVPTRTNVPFRANVREGFAQVAFTSADVGVVRDGFCTGGENGPCGGDLYTTADGGRQLTKLPDPISDGWTSVAQTQVGSLIAFAGLGGDGGELATSGDGGRHWRLQAPARQLSTNWLTGMGSTVRWCNTLGPFISHDGGRRWQAVRGARARAAFDRHRRSPRKGASYRSDRWTARRLLSKHPWILYSTDRGRAWTGHQVPRHLGLNASRLVATGPGAAILVDGGALWRTTDGGATWRQSWPHLPGEG